MAFVGVDEQLGANTVGRQDAVYLFGFGDGDAGVVGAVDDEQRGQDLLGAGERRGIVEEGAVASERAVFELPGRSVR